MSCAMLVTAQRGVHKMGAEETAFYDCSRRNPTIRQLAMAKKGARIMHDHSSYKMPFSVWLAQQRQRLRRELTGPRFITAKPTDKLYIITVGDELPSRLQKAAKKSSTRRVGFPGRPVRSEDG